jgi:hypothetical protein
MKFHFSHILILVIALFIVTGLYGALRNFDDNTQEPHKITVLSMPFIENRGQINNSDFPTTPNAFDTSYNGGYSDTWVSRLDSNLAVLIASTYLGGSINPGVLEQSYSIAIGDNRVYVCGMTPSSDCPIVPSCYDEIHGGGRDIFVSKFDRDLSYGLGIEEEKTRPNNYCILSCNPNPFIKKIDIRWQPAPLSGASSGIPDNSAVDLRIYDISGRLVRSFNHTTMRLSDYISWDGCDDANKKLPSGVYILKLQIDDHSETAKLLMLR